MSLSAILFATALLFQGVDETGTAIARPVGEAYFEETTGSYFQVMEFYGRPPHTWRHANAMVRGYVYKGREGRLAHVTSQSVHYFLLVNFPALRQKPMWIGLSATCNERAEVAWHDGPDIRDQTFRAWNDGTRRRISRTCRANVDTGLVLPIFYTSDELGTRWEAGSAGQNLRFMMAEFPAPPKEVETPEGEDAKKGESATNTHKKEMPHSP
jgi:hypothetical protein